MSRAKRAVGHLLAAGVALAGAGALLGFQLLAARRRALILDPPPPRDGAFFGDPSASTVRLVIVGDSTAVGVGAAAIEETYPWRVAEYLGGSFHVRLNLVGRSGARMADVARELAPKAAALSPDVALIGVGANDVTHLTPLRSVYGSAYEAIRILQGAGAEVLIALGPRFDTPILQPPLRNFVRTRARALNRTLVRSARASGAEVVDLPTGVGDAFASDPARYYCADRYHPSGDGYALWADVIREPLMKAARVKVLERARPA